MTGKNKQMSLWWPTLLFTLCFVIGCDSSEIVIDDLSQREANEVLVLLRDQDIEASKVVQASKKNTVYQIRVKKKHAKDALRLLVHNQIPKTHRAGLKEIYPPGSSGIIPTKSDELARMMMAMQGEAEALLKVIPGMADARVIISYEPPLDYNKTMVKKTASVAIIYYPQLDTNQSPLSDSEIKNLIAASISGLLPEDVMVVQKSIEPKDYQSQPKHAITSPVVKDPSSFSPWYLMLLTILALVIAAYAVLRIFWQRRQTAISERAA